MVRGGRAMVERGETCGVNGGSRGPIEGRAGIVGGELRAPRAPRARGRVARVAAAALALVPLANTATAGELWRVGDELGAVPLAHALDLATDGDVLVLSAGVHASDAVIGDRGVTLVGDPGAVLRGHLTITGDDPRVRVQLVGLTIEPPPWDAAPAVRVVDFAGSAWFQACEVAGADVYAAPYPPLAETGPAVQAIGAAEVVFSGCVLYGGSAPPCAAGGPPAGPGSAALVNVGSRVALFDSRLRGGDGGADDYAIDVHAGPGGAALFQRSGAFTLAWNSRLVGGDGGFAARSLDGFGGAGVVNEGWLVDACAASFQGGFGAEPGVHVACDGGRVQESEGWPRELVVTNPNRDDATVEVLVRGVPGEAVVLELGREARLPLAGARGDSVPSMLPTVAREVPLGIVPPSGVILRRFPAGSLPADTGATSFAQARHESAAGTVRGPATCVVVIDA